MTNSFGNRFKFTSWGESHGKAIGCVVDGVPANIELSEKDIQPYLDIRKPGGSKLTSSRKEEDQVEILAGVFDGKTTGAPISLIIYNKDHNSSDYEENKNKFRPGHAEFCYFHKYGHYDYRGGGRSSARETAMRVAAGAIARKIVPMVSMQTIIIQIGPIKAEERNWNYASSNQFYCPCSKTLPQWEKLLTELKEQGDSVGAILETKIQNAPVGLGDPIYGKIDAIIASAIISINAVKGVEFGRAFDNVERFGSELVDEIMVNDQGKIEFLANNNSGVLGGISTGQDITIRYAAKATSSIQKELRTIDRFYNNTTISTSGRHDPCVALRLPIIAESMLYCVFADLSLHHSALVTQA